MFNAVNQYTYAQGNPVFYWDPTGRDTTGLGSLAFVGFGFGGLGSFAFVTGAASPSGPGVSGLRAPEPTPLEKTGQGYLRAVLFANGVELVDFGFLIAELSLASSPVTGPTSLIVIGSGLFIATVGTVEIGAALYMDTGAGAQ